jgi:hypothetical protein
MQKSFLRRMGVAMACLMASGACGGGEDTPAAEPAQASCFSPEQTPELAIDQPGRGCPCDGDADQCVATTYYGRAWSVGLVCTTGRWTRNDDVCAPPLPESCPDGTRGGVSCMACGPSDTCEVGETACLAVCIAHSDCTDPKHPLCLQGLCVQACG